MTAQLATESQHWLHQYNVEQLLCWLPDFDQVCDGVHIVTAVGNDGMAVNITVDNEAVVAAARADGHVAELVQLAYLGRMLQAFRWQEVTAGQPR
jgi:hypothetical protein